MAAPVKVARRQTTPRNSPEPSEPCLRNLHQDTPELSGTFDPAYLHHTPELSGTFRNLPSLPPEPTPAYTGTLRNLPEPSGTCLWNQHHFIGELSGTFRYTSTHGNSPEPSGTFQDLPEPTFRNLRQQTPEPSGTFRNLPLRNLPEPAPGTYTSIRRNLPEPSEPASGAYTSTRRNSPEPSGTSFRNLLLRPAPAHTGTYLG